MPMTWKWLSCACVLLLLAGCGDEQPPPDSPGTPLVGDLARGGQLYDNWWAVALVNPPEGEHPLWATRPDQESNTRKGPTTWRCKECHGWDYKGVTGAYGLGSHKTGFAGILGSSKEEAELTSLLKETHGYGAAGLSDQDIADLVAFVRGGLLDSAELIDADGLFTGSAADGATIYRQGIGENKRCAACHGQDGLESPKDDPEYEDFVGLIAVDNPWELLHKIRFGQPATKMPRGVDADVTIQQLKDLGSFSQSLPTER